MNVNSTKTCPVCAEVIPAAARICPRCRQWLTLRSLRHPLTYAATVGVPMIGVFVYLVLMLIGRVDGLMNPRPFFSEMPESLHVLDAKMSWVETTNGPRIYVIGTLTNQSQIAWKDVEFQCRFFGTNGVMIDASYPGARLTILPGSDAAFRGSVIPARPVEDYRKVEVTVSTARNVKAPF